MDPVEIVKLFANPYTAVVAVLAAAVEEAPDEWLLDSVRRCIGWLCVAACAPVALALGQDVAPAMFGGFLGLGGSWLLVEAVRARRAGRAAVVSSRPRKETAMTNHEHSPEHENDNPHRQPEPKPGHDDDEPAPENDGPPPHPPPPPPDLKGLRERLGRLAFEAYNASRGGKAHDGSPIPGWENVREEIREAWRVAAVAVAESLPAAGA